MNHFMFVVILSSTCDCRIALTDDKEAKTVEMKTIEESVAMVASIPQHSTAGCEILLKLQVENQSNEEMGYLHYYPKYRNVGLSVHDSRGKAVPFTSFGKLTYDSVHGEGSAGEISLKSKKPRMLTLNLARVFDLTIPGEYSVTVNWYVTPGQPTRKGINLRIEKLRFRITEELR